MAEQGIRILFLVVRHSGIKLLEDRDEILKPIRMGLGDFTIGLEIFNSGHGLSLFAPCLVEGVHCFGIVPHHLGDLIPEVFLGWCDFEPGMKVCDACLGAVDFRDLGRGLLGRGCPKPQGKGLH